MWQIKKFKTYEKYSEWVIKNKTRYQITEIFINNAYGVEYRPLITIY